MERFIFKIALAAFLFASCNNATETNTATNHDTTIVTPLVPGVKETQRMVRISAKPDSVAIDPLQTAVIVVDMENDFGAKGGMMDRDGINITMIQKIIKPTANVLAAARQAGVPVIYLKMGYHPDLSDLGAEGSPNRVGHLRAHVGDTIVAPNGVKNRILIRDNWGTDIVNELKPQTDDIVLYKTRFSGFYKTALDSTLKGLGKKYLVFTGCTTSVCVESTVRDAMFRDYSPIVLEDCTAEPIAYDLPRSNHEASLFVIQQVLGWVSNSNNFITAITPPLLSNQQLK
jgi:ureidoacrylate peracid hydrolase